jgi:cell division protein FtsW (lipid II flippase)
VLVLLLVVLLVRHIWTERGGLLVVVVVLLLLLLVHRLWTVMTRSARRWYQLGRQTLVPPSECRRSNAFASAVDTSSSSSL